MWESIARLFDSEKKINCMDAKISTPAQTHNRYNSPPVDLSGSYERTGATLRHSERDLTLVIGTRKKVSLTKPKHYLLRKYSRSRFEYVSSLFPIEDSDSTFSIDYKSRHYHITLSESSAQVVYQAQGAKC